MVGGIIYWVGMGYWGDGGKGGGRDEDDGEGIVVLFGNDQVQE